MKRIIPALLLTAGLLLCSAPEFIYPATLRITELDYEADIVRLETSTGIPYTLSGCEDWLVGDLVSAVMWTCNTPSIRDDAILLYRYSGFMDIEFASDPLYLEYAEPMFTVSGEVYTL